jgi:hypothetical protein
MAILHDPDAVFVLENLSRVARLDTTVAGAGGAGARAEVFGIGGRGGQT